MEVRTCKICKRLFNYLAGVPICPGCKEKLDEKFAEVKEYVRDNPRAGITEVAEAVEVPATQIRRWIREERLSFSEESGVGLDCESCGKLIKSGRFCEECKTKLLGNFNDLYRQDESIVAKKHREAARMRFLDGQQ